MNSSGQRLLVSILIVVVAIVGFVAGGFTGYAARDPARASWWPFGPPSPTATPVTAEVQQQTPEELRRQFEIFWQVWSLLEDRFYDPSRVDYQKMVYGAISGMVGSVGDDYTFFSTPAQAAVSRTSLSGEYEGIGAYIDTQGGWPIIQGPVSNDSPAARAGLRKGDIVLAVDGVDVEGMQLEEVIARIKGPAGTQVTLKIARQGQEAFEVTITRAHIEVPSVEGEMRDDGLAYVRLSIFGSTTAQELDSTLEELLAQNPQGLILDLRGNGGGYLTAAQEVLGRFLREGVATYEADRDGNRTPLGIIPGQAQVFDLPMVVLVDGGSASASEITAGALQDYGRATLIGEQTFGKGSIQDISEFPDGSAVRITIAHWLTPQGRQIQDKGLTPEIIVTLTPEDYDQGLDPQLDTAAAYLLNQPLPPVAATPTPKP